MHTDRHGHHTISRGGVQMMGVIGLGLLWPLPLGGAVLVSIAVFVLAVLADAELDGTKLRPALIEPAGRR